MEQARRYPKSRETALRAELEDKHKQELAALRMELHENRVREAIFMHQLLERQVKRADEAEERLEESQRAGGVLGSVGEWVGFTANAGVNVFKCKMFLFRMLSYSEW